MVQTLVVTDTVMLYDVVRAQTIKKKGGRRKLRRILGLKIHFCIFKIGITVNFRINIIQNLQKQWLKGSLIPYVLVKKLGSAYPRQP